MTTLERLREAQQNRRRTVDVGGVGVVLQPMTAREGMAFQKKFADIQGLTADDPRLADFYCELVAVCAVEPESNVKALDSDEGRELLRALPMQEQIQLGFAAAEVNGFAVEADAKKN